MNISKILTGMVLSAVCATQAMALHRSVKLDCVGEVWLTCPDSNGWTFQMTRRTHGNREVAVIEKKADSATVPPRFSVGFNVPLGEIGYLWHAGDDGRCHLVPSWLKKYPSDIASGIPLYTLLDSENTNRLTFAVSEPFRRIETKVGALEDNARVEGELSFFTQPEAPLSRYHVEIMFDAGNRFYGHTIADATDWIMDRCGIKAAPVPEAAFDPLYSSWYQFHQDMTAADIEAESRLAARLGMKNIIVDDGWQTGDNNRGYAYCGDWEVYEGKFPDMAAHVGRVHDAGMRYMMWYSVPYVGVNSRNHQRFKGMYLTDDRTTDVLDPRFPEVREFLSGIYENALRDWNLDGLKLDFIDRFKFTGEDPAVAQNYAGRDIKSLPAAVDTLMNGISRRLRAINPDVLIEFRQEYIGPAIRQYGNMLRANDCPCDAEGNRRRVATLRMTSGNTAVHSDMLEWNVSDAPEAAARHVLSAIFGVVQYSMMLRTLPQEHLAMIQHWMGFSQKHRKTLLRSDFRALYPQSGYPVIEAESDDELIVGSYSSGNIVSVGDVDKPVYLLNATGRGSMAVELARQPVSAEVYDTFGNLTAKIRPDKGLGRIEVPRSGYVKLNYE